jgi:hypothetical protein
MKRIGLLLIFCLILLPQRVSAQGGNITVSANAAEMTFPNNITFKIYTKSDSEITLIRLHYGTTQDTCGKVAAIAFPEFDSAKDVYAEWEWDMRQSGGEPPGATIWWQWEIKDKSGNTLMTDKKEVIWLDKIHSWQELSEGMIRIHYYMGSKSFANTLKDAAVTALDKLGKDTGITTDEPIDLYIYGDTQDMRDSVLYEPGWTGGLAYQEYNIVIIGIAPEDAEWGKRTEAHELTHVLVGDFTFSCLGAMPTWMVEGIAVYGEGGPEESGVTNFEKNKNDNSLLSFKVLSGGFSEDPNQADLSYSQSYYMVNYLIEKYGKDKLIGFLKLLKTGGELNESLRSIYGIDLAGFENEWRSSLSLPIVEVNSVQVTATPTIIPTIIPIERMLPAATISPRPTFPTTIIDKTPLPSETTGIQNFMQSSTVKSILMIIIGGTCVFGILLIAGITILLVRNRKRTNQKGGLQ